MKKFTDERDTSTLDELWVVEHPHVFTLGQAGKAEHILNAGDVPIVNSDRGGQVTYHGPGQTVIYLMIDVKRLGIGSRALVEGIEQAIIAYLATLNVQAELKPGAPGVYVKGAKIASLGLRIRKAGSYHGLSLNRDVDMAMFERINPCGYAGQAMTSLALLNHSDNRTEVENGLLQNLASQFGATLMEAESTPDWYNNESAALR